ncbi:MAG: multidrug DMT transporter [Clostridiaceae bacterium]|nr:multidrug DMT transporter [Clostridiaceae bacterium]
MSWFDDLQQASFRGVPFGVLSADIQAGRRLAPHEYPYRDAPWIEDLGRAMRRIHLVGFLLEGDAIYGGGDVIAQRDQMLAALETAGPATLVHPTLGRLVVNAEPATITEKWESGRYFELNFSFIEHGQRLFPSVTVATGSASLSDAIACDVASVLTFVARLNRLLLWPSEMIKRISATASFWGALGQNLVDDATRLYNMPGTLQGTYGRFFGGARKQTSSPRATTSATVASQIAAGTASRTAVAAAARGLTSAAAALTPASASARGAAAQAMAAAVRAAIVDPADGIRLLAQLASYTPTTATMNSVVGQAMATGQSASGDLFRRAAVAAAARAAAVYQPNSADDAVNVRDTVTALIDAEITVAGDQGEDDAYNGLRALRASVVADLNARGAALSSLQLVTVGASLPAPVLAQRLYRDGKRSDELVGEANPRHPAFMPTKFRALAS